MKTYIFLFILILAGCSTDDSPPEYAGYVSFNPTASSYSTSANRMITVAANPSISGYVYLIDSTWYTEEGPAVAWFMYPAVDITSVWFTEPGLYTVAYRYKWRDGYGAVTYTIGRVTIEVLPAPANG